MPFASKFQRIHPGTTGVTVLEHLERLDAVEASLQRLNVDDSDEEDDVGVAASPPRPAHLSRSQNGSSSSIPPNGPLSPILSPPGSPLPTVHEVPSMASSMTEEDLVAMSRSTSHADAHSRWASQVARNVDWLQNSDAVPKRTVIVEVRFHTAAFTIFHAQLSYTAAGDC